METGPFTDESRPGREVYLTFWYPANEETDALSMHDAPVYKGGGPYPLILTESTTGSGLFESHLVSHGFVMVEVGGGDDEEYDYTGWNRGLFNDALDLLFALDQIASNPPEELEGVIDTEHVGVAGYSYGGFNTLAVSGARVDPEFFHEQCANAEPGDPVPESWWIDFYCKLTGKWEALLNKIGPEITTGPDGLWQPLSDPRIRAVLPMSPEGSWLFGERGLAAVDRPTMLLAGTEDTICYYDLEAAYIFENLGTPERHLISFIGQSHNMVHISDQAKRMNHFVTAFFGYYLQGREEYAEYYSEDFVAQFDDLAWGVYPDE
jgi:predicted dienelactone hydrolase